MNTTQIELQKQYKKNIDEHMDNSDYLEDVTRCGTCGSSNVYFTQKQNGIVKDCKNCDKYIERYEN